MRKLYPFEEKIISLINNAHAMWVAAEPGYNKPFGDKLLFGVSKYLSAVLLGHNSLACQYADQIIDHLTKMKALHKEQDESRLRPTLGEIPKEQ